jgi:uncharacterized protein VirK/YbjX
LSKSSSAIRGYWDAEGAETPFQRTTPLTLAGARKAEFLGSALQLARQDHEWSFSLLGRVFWDVTTNFARQAQIFRLLMQPAFAGLVPKEPRLPFKYLSKDYLARGLTVAERAACFVHHYEHLVANLPYNILRRTLHRDLSVLELREGEALYRVTMGLSRCSDIGQDKEGELALKLLVDETQVFVLAFTVVPGSVVGSPSRDVLLISRLQGVRGCYREISSATKAMHEVAPAALLVAALRGVAEACGIREMAGVCAIRQVNYSEDLSSSFKKTYDDFFSELGATRTAANFYSSPLPFEEKPLSFVKKGHKTRTKDKRAFKLQVAQEVCGRIREAN